MIDLLATNKNMMRILNRDISGITLIGDIHSAPNELLSIIKQSRDRGIDRFLSLGDLYDRGYDCNATTDIIYDLIKEGKLEIVLGNHCWKYVRHIAGKKVNISEEQEKTLQQLTSASIEKFLEIYKDLPVGVYDPKRKYFITHAASGSPNDILLRDYRKNPYNNKFKTYTDYLECKEDKLIDKKYCSNMMYGLTDNTNAENGRPNRLPITKSVDDDLDGWFHFFGHQHSNCFYPESGNKHSICLDYSCSEEGGKLAALIIPASGEIAEENLIFSPSSC